MMKKILLALLAALMIFTFSACGSTDNDQKGTDDSSVTDKDVTTDSDLSVDEDKPRYTSDGDLIVEEDRPASDSDLTEDSETDK